MLKPIYFIQNVAQYNYTNTTVVTSKSLLVLDTKPMLKHALAALCFSTLYKHQYLNKENHSFDSVTFLTLSSCLHFFFIYYLCV